METGICPAKHLGMNQRTRGTRHFARRPLSSRLGLHASVPSRQHGDTARRLKSTCRPGLDYVARSCKHLLGQSSEFTYQKIFMPQSTPGNQQFRSQFLSTGKLCGHIKVDSEIQVYILTTRSVTFICGRIRNPSRSHLSRLSPEFLTGCLALYSQNYKET